jgi:hypothetical protein
MGELAVGLAARPKASGDASRIARRLADIVFVPDYGR